MHVVGISLIGPPDSVLGVADAELIRDALWAHAPTRAGLEHITVTVSWRAIEIVVFLDEEVTDPESFASALLTTAASRSEILNKWIRNNGLGKEGQ